MKNPKGIIVTIILIAFPIFWLAFTLNNISDKYNETSGDKITVSNEFRDYVNELVENETNSKSGDNKPSGEQEGSKYGVPISKVIIDARINTDTAFIYEEPDETSATIGSVNKDVPITAQNYPNGWSNVKVGETSGWIKTSLIVNPEDVSPSLQTAVGKNATVIVDTLNVRPTASTVGDPIDQLSFGDSFKIIDENADSTWYQIQYNTSSGWIRADSKYIQVEY